MVWPACTWIRFPSMVMVTIASLILFSYCHETHAITPEAPSSLAHGGINGEPLFDLFKGPLPRIRGEHLQLLPLHPGDDPDILLPVIDPDLGHQPLQALIIARLHLFPLEKEVDHLCGQTGIACRPHEIGRAHV